VKWPGQFWRPPNPIYREDEMSNPWPSTAARGSDDELESVGLN
jgi:hypothetical protein